MTLPPPWPQKTGSVQSALLTQASASRAEQKRQATALDRKSGCCS